MEIPFKTPTLCRVIEVIPVTFTPLYFFCPSKICNMLHDGLVGASLE